MGVSAPWICDACGEEITRVEDGWVEWLTRYKDQGYEGSYRSLRLVHHKPASPRAKQGGCYLNERHFFDQDRSTVSDLRLEWFSGPDGLVKLLEFLADKRFEDQNEVLEMIKRLHVPNHEAARNHFEAAAADGAFEPRTCPGYHSQEEIAATLEWVKARAEA